MARRFALRLQGPRGRKPRLVAFTHWAYFTDRDDADGCAAQLQSESFAVELEPSREETWLVRATRRVMTDAVDERHADVKAVVHRFGGTYTGGSESAPTEDLDDT